MNNTLHLKEIELIKNYAGDFPRHPDQVNGLLEADAEIIRLPGTGEKYLVLKTDGIHEEIKEKLYDDFYLIGWMAVTAPVSDIAAVGAIPTGILLSQLMPRHMDETNLQKFKSGINDACSVYGIYVLGGDTNIDDTFSISATVVAGLYSQKPLLRKGMQPGDLLYATALLGSGNAFAYSRFFDTSLNINYKPLARLKESRLIIKYASACTDTSDGLFPALSVLSEINHAGFQLDTPLQSLLHTEALLVQQKAALPSWMFMAGPHGEYELIFSIPPGVQKEFEAACKLENHQPVYLGKVIREKQLSFTSESLEVQCNLAITSNLFYESNGDVQYYFDMLLQQHKNWMHQ